MISRKTLSILLLILLVFCFISSVCTITVDAASKKCPICSENHDTSELSFPNSWTYEMACKLYGGDIMTADTEEVLQFNVSGSKFYDLWKKGEDIYNGFALLGKLLLTVYVLYDLFTKASMDNLTAEHVAKAFMRMAIGIVIINNGYTMIGAASEFITNVFNAIANPPAGGNPMAEHCNFSAMKRAKWHVALVDASTLFIPWILMLFASGILSVICWMRILDIVIRVIFAPVGMADIMNDGLRSSGWRYFKKLLSSLTQGALLIVIIRAYNMVLPIVTQMDGLASWAMPIVLSFVMMALFFKASGMASEVIG